MLHFEDASEKASTNRQPMDRPFNYSIGALGKSVQFYIQSSTKLLNHISSFRIWWHHLPGHSPTISNPTGRRRGGHFLFPTGSCYASFHDKLVQFINDTFRNRQFQTGGANSWPTAESDLTPLDLFLCGKHDSKASFCIPRRHMWEWRYSSMHSKPHRLYVFSFMPSSTLHTGK